MRRGHAMEVWAYFGGMVTAFCAALFFGRRLGDRKDRKYPVAVAVGCCALVVVYVLCRFRIDLAARIFGVEPLAFLESTGIVPPAAFVFVFASRRQENPRAARGLVGLAIILGVFMISRWAATLYGVEAATVNFIDADGVVMQTTDDTCGAASLVGLLAAYGISASENEMAGLALTDYISGTSEIRMLRALKVKLDGTGLVPFLSKLDYSELMGKPMPCVIVVKYNMYIEHVVLVKQMYHGGLLMDDPIKGRIGWTKPVFLREWGGYAIWIDDRRGR
ncbi:MAG: cysteine peptidase family C39 domain-containing protein [Planctomycetota bacterium]|nr:cysteine peptidase family C39 domain-containing protein [Planctomycetota bacterium]